MSSTGVGAHEIWFTADDRCRVFAVEVGAGRRLVLLHGGGPDHCSLIPLGHRLCDLASVILPDVRSFGRSVCRDPARHTWQRYADDVITILDQLGEGQAVLGGTGMGAGIAMRTALSAPKRVSGLILVSPEHGGEDRPSPEEVGRQQAMADTILTRGLGAAWQSWFPLMPAGMAAMVRDALPRADAESQAAALRAIADQEPLEQLEELRALEMPTLVVAGSDPNHPPELAERYATVLVDVTVAALDLWTGVAGASDVAERAAPPVRRFLQGIGPNGGSRPEADGAMSSTRHERRRGKHVTSYRTKPSP